MMEMGYQPPSFSADLWIVPTTTTPQRQQPCSLQRVRAQYPLYSSSCERFFTGILQIWSPVPFHLSLVESMDCVRRRSEPIHHGSLSHVNWMFHLRGDTLWLRLRWGVAFPAQQRWEWRKEWFLRFTHPYPMVGSLSFSPVWKQTKSTQSISPLRFHPVWRNDYGSDHHRSWKVRRYGPMFPTANDLNENILASMSSDPSNGCIINAFINRILVTTTISCIKTSGKIFP